MLVIAVQNAVDYHDLGVATSGATLFRLIGGSLGTAVFGAVFASRLTAYLRSHVAAGIELPTAGLRPQGLAEMEPAMRALYVEGFTSALSVVFLSAMFVAAVGFLLTWLVPELLLRHTIAEVAKDLGHEAEELFPMPTDASAVQRFRGGPRH